MRLVEVALPLPLQKRFTYGVPDGMAMPGRGARVVVGFGRRRLVGFAAGEAERAPEGVRLQAVRQVVDTEPVLSDSEWRLAEWMARYYVAPLGLVLRLFFPPGGTPAGRGDDAGSGAPTGPLERLHVLPPDAPAGAGPATAEPPAVLARASGQQRAWMAAQALDGPEELGAFCAAAGVTPAVVRALAARGLVRLEPRAVHRDPHAGGAELPESPPEGELTAAQRTAADAIRAALAAEAGQTFLLQGVTGSGKTRVYVEATAAAVAAGGRVIILVPEIGLAAPIVSRFRARFGGAVAVLHSGLSDGERQDAWRRVRTGEAPIVIGARSALFAPVGRAALIVVDEEHEPAYKQDETPRYLARDVAVYRAALEGGVAVLGSATPSLESRANAGSGKYGALSLPIRIAARPMPEVEIINLAVDGALAGPGLSVRLAAALDEALAAGDQALLFLNRRGFASFVQCTDCGWVAECPNCRIALTYHRRRTRLLCHYCAHEAVVPETCPTCRGRRLDTRGLGTQQVEQGLADRFPAARIGRMDLDTTGAKWAHARIYRAMQARALDILVGTQMIAKGFDLPGVALVGVVSADTGLHLPDFRATERTVQLLLQVAGRAGRGDRAGRVILQTYLPDHPAITSAAAHDYEGFYARELAEREPLGYPPARRLANVVVSGAEADAAAAGAARVAAAVRAAAAAGDVTLVGPAPCPLERLRGRSRHHCLLKARTPAALERVLWDLARRADELVGSANRLEIDRDPLSML